MMAEHSGGEGLYRVVREGAAKAPFTRIAVRPAGGMAVVRVFTAKPDTFQARRTPELIENLERVVRRGVTIEVTPEARALAKYVRVPPNKARRVLDAIRGMYVD